MLPEIQQLNGKTVQTGVLTDQPGVHFYGNCFDHTFSPESCFGYTGSIPVETQWIGLRKIILGVLVLCFRQDTGAFFWQDHLYLFW